MKVQYRFVNGDLVDVEVPQEYGEALADLDRRERNNNQTETRRHVSLDMMVQDQGVQFQCVEDLEERVYLRQLHAAIDLLPKDQCNLVKRVFLQGVPLVDIAGAEGVSYQAIQNRMRSALKRLKKFM